jgi:hypothetical protein
LAFTFNLHNLSFCNWQDNHNNKKYKMEKGRIRSAVALFAAGCAIIFGLMVTVYLIASALDKFMCFNASEFTLTPQELEERRVASDLTRKAGLAGMLSSERSRVFRAFFEKSSIPYGKPSEEDDDDDIEAQKKKEDSGTELKDSSKMASKGGVKAAKAQEDESSESAVENEAENGENSEGIVCAICLTEYGTSLLYCCG